MKVFDATLFDYKPVLPVSFEKLPHVNENFIFDGTVLNETKLQKYVSKNQLLQFDIEKAAKTPEIMRNLQLRIERLGPARHGFFALPVYLYDLDQRIFDAWAQKYKTVLDHVDVFFPDMYTYAAEPFEWGRRLDFMVTNMRKIAGGRPIYPFLWYLYPSATPTYIGDEFWQYELNQCRKKVDGVAVWGGYQEPWDNNAGWWKILQKYL